ncbi:MAG: DUF559 domain-containing protein [Mycobacteriales bacterium]|nr:DUF559 domain-containing protein [Mycobacteriales bacterium]
MDTLSAVTTCGCRREGLSSLRSLRAAGLDVRRLHSTEGVHRLLRGVYSSRPLPPWPRFVLKDAMLSEAYVVRVRAALLHLGPRAVASGRTAALLRGWALLMEPRSVEVALPNGRRQPSATWVVVRQRRGDVARELLHESLGREGLWATAAVQTAVDCLVQLSRLEAVVAVDSALRSKQVTLQQVADAVDALPGRPERARARRALAQCDPLSESVLESVLRVRMLDAGLVGFASQSPLRCADGTKRADFCFAAARLVVEADGARWHPDGSLDRQRDNQLAAAGWRVLRFTWAEVVHRPATVIALIRAALAAVSAAA